MEVEAEAEAGVNADPEAEVEACYSGWIWLEDAWHLLGLGPRTTAGAPQRTAALLRTAGWARAWRARRQRVGSEEEAGRRRAAVVEARRRRKAVAKAGRRRAFEAAAARAAAVASAAVEHAAAGRAAAERALIFAAVVALERRAAAEGSAALAALAAVFDGSRALTNPTWAPEPRGAGAGCAGAQGLRSREGGRRAVPGSSRRRPHVRWRARRESYYIRRPPLVLLQQRGGGKLDVCMAASRPGG